MKNLKNYLIYNQNTKGYITEKQNFLIKNKNVLKDYDEYDYHPKDDDELVDIIVDLLKQGETNLNCIDVSKITDMRSIFYTVNDKIKVKEINISEWDVSNVKYMGGMFNGCEKFNSDLSKWDVSNVNYMGGMFCDCEEFNSDLSKWDVSNVEDMCKMFNGCELFNSDLSNWNVSNVKDMSFMFLYCTEFNSDISKWDVSKVKDMKSIFDGCFTLINNNKIPDWYKE